MIPITAKTWQNSYPTTGKRTQKLQLFENLFKVFENPLNKSKDFERKYGVHRMLTDIINRYIQGEGKLYTSAFEEVYSKNDTERSLKLKQIESIHEYFKEFLIFYNSYNIYMNTKQVVLINKMISEQYTEKAFKIHKNLPKEESLTKEQLDKYIILVDQLFSSINK